MILEAAQVATLPLPGLLEAMVGPDGLNDPLLAPEPPPQAPLDDQAAGMAELGRQALVYMLALDLVPLTQPRLQGADLRYVAGPLIVFDPAWGADIPDWLRTAIRPARLGLVLAGEKQLASEEEAVVYLMTASLAQPLDPSWARIYLWLGGRVLVRWGKLPGPDGYWQMLGEDVPGPGLARDQATDLGRLRFWLRRQAARTTGRPGHSAGGRAPQRS